ncbi:MAG: PD-(D/E)XK nuclease family protein, partial [Clostridia bacterium]|nr:PD-(D/E)XK nuclease family protein [Clostridia bacterium]
TTLAWMLCAYAANRRREDLPISLVFPGKEAEDPETAEPTPEGETASDNADGISYRAAKALVDRVFAFAYPEQDKITLPAKLSVSEIVHMQTAASGTSGEPPAEKQYAKPRFLQTEAEAEDVGAAARGTATHSFMQFCDFAALSARQGSPLARVDAEIERLRAGRYLDAETVSLIDRYALTRFLDSRLFTRLRYAEDVRREVRFNLFVSADEIPGYTGGDAQVLVQGIIDCCYITSDGHAVLIDYKTDHFPREIREDREQVEAILTERYKDQLRFYRAAAEQLLCRPVDDVRIYSFAIGDDFSVM